MRRIGPLALPVLVALMAAACAPHRLALPTGPGAPAPDYAGALAAATSRCRDVQTLTVELSLSGHVGKQRVRGRVLAGFAPGAVRLEGVAPIGGPVFILVADGLRGRLLLSRDHRLLDGASPADMLDALVGVPLGPDDLRALLGGCVKASVEPSGGRAYGTDWIVVDLAGGGSIYLRREPSGWRIVAGRYSDLEVEYGALAGSVPGRLDIQSPAAAGRSDVSLGMNLTQVEVNGELDRLLLVNLTVPPGTSPITIEELRRSGPLGAP